MSSKKSIPSDDLLLSLKAGESVASIGDRYGASHKAVYRMIRELGVSAKELRFDHRFFRVINTENKAYWLGYFMADGCVTTTQANRVELASNDLEHLRKWHEAIGSSHRVLLSGGGRNGKSVHCSEKMVADLARHGVVPRKSLALRWPNTVPGPLIRHLIRGYFDGDGSLYRTASRGRRLQPTMSFVGTREVLLGIRTALGYRNAITSRKNVFVMTFSGTNKVKSAADWLYEGATIYLERKWLLWQSMFYQAVAA